jgi:hypothetical protein
VNVLRCQSWGLSRSVPAERCVPCHAQVRIKPLCVLSVCFRNVRGIVAFDRSRHFRINQLLWEP